MLGIGTNELLIIIVFAFLLFGPDKLPGMGRTIGRALRQFREAQEGFTQVVQSEVVDPLNDAMKEPSKKSKDKEAAHKQALDDDADLDAESTPSSHTETFAERRARLKAEKEAKETAALKAEQDEALNQKAATAESTDKSLDRDQSHAKDGSDQSVSTTAVDKEAQDGALSAQSLYSISPRKEEGDTH